MGVLVQIVPDCARDAVAYPCGCEFVDVMQMVQNIMIDMIYLGTFVLVLLLVYVGFLYVTNAGNPANITKAKSIAMSAIIGFVIMMGGFLIVSTVMDTFAKKDLSGGWTSFFGVTRSACELTATSPRAPGVVVSEGGGGTGTTDSCTDCVPLEPLQIQCKNSGCQASADFAQRLQSLLGSSGLANWRVTEAIPTTATHQCGCHYNGTCVDVNFTGNLQAGSPISISLGQELGTAIALFIDAASRQGLTAEYEVPTNEEKENIYTAPNGPNPNSIKVISAITAPHFSVYGPAGCQRR